MVCAAVMLAGYVVLVFRGPAPAVAVSVNIIPAEAAPSQ